MGDQKENAGGQFTFSVTYAAVHEAEHRSCENEVDDEGHLLSRKISEAITASRYPHLIGDWKSVYPLTFEDGCPMVDEVIEVRPGRNGLTFRDEDQFAQRLLYRVGLPNARSSDSGQVEVS